MKKYLHIIITLVAISAITGCAVGRKLSFQNEQGGPGYNTTKSATVVFHDQRQEVLSGKLKPSFCGHINSTVQISYNVHTQSGRPLADEFSESVSASYGKTGAASGTLLVNSNAVADSIIKAFKADNRDRLLYFRINKWESRAIPKWSTVAYEVIYDLDLNVYNKNGELLASSNTHDIAINEKGAAGISVKQLQAMSDEVFNQQIAKLFANDAVRNSL